MLTLEQRLARLEAAEAVRGTMMSYAQLMDAGLVDEVLQLFAKDSQLIALNEPPGSGGSVRRSGIVEIDTHYRALRYGTFRHHLTNVSVDVTSDAKIAELSALFLTSYRHAIKGGFYEVKFERQNDGQWRIKRMHITSSWGWHVSDPNIDYFALLGAQALRGGRPVRWDLTLTDAAAE